MLRYRAILNRVAIGVLVPGITLLFAGGLGSGFWYVTLYAAGVFAFVVPLLYLNAEYYDEQRQRELREFWQGDVRCEFCTRLVGERPTARMLDWKYWCDETCYETWRRENALEAPQA